MKGVIYARYSSDNQREESIEGQLRECKEYAERNDITILGTYIDRALSAKTDNRPEFQHMIKESAKGLFDVVLVWKLDRFARNRYDSARYKNLLKKNGVKVISARENISEGSEGIILEAMLEGYAEYYSAELSEKVIRGLTDNALKCKYNGGTVPMGYYIDEQQYYQIDPKTAPVVLEMFTKYSEGATMQELVNLLNSRGMRSIRGGKITLNIMNHLLKNRRYMGEYSYRDVVKENGIPAIVPKELFERVQERLAKNKKAPARHKAEDDYLLTTKLYCGKCGSFMVGESGTSHTMKVHRYYRCVNTKKKKLCDKKAVKKDWIEDLVVNYTMKAIMNDEVMERLIDTLMELQKKESTDLPLLKKQLAETEKGINNMLNAIQAGIFTPSTKQRLDELEETKSQLEVSILQEEMHKPLLTREQIAFFIYRFRKFDVTKREQRQRLIDSFVNAVYLYEDKIILTFNYKDGSKTITLAEVEGSDLSVLGAPNTEAPVGCLCVWLSRTGLEAGETKRSCGAFCPAGERKQSGRAARSASKGRFERRVPPPAPNTEAPVGCLCVWLSRTGLEAGETKRSCGAFCPAGERKQSGRAARSASKGRFERRVPPPAPNTEAPVGCLCVWLNRTGLEAGETKRSCGAFCPAGERKQSGRAARSASKGRFERRVPPPAPNTEAPVGCLCVWLSRTGLEAGETKRSCGAFCPAGERKQSGRAARSAGSGMQLFVQHTLYAIY